MTLKFIQDIFHKKMKYASLFLVLVVILCSIGFDDEANHSYDLSDIINYTNHEHESFGTKSISNSHKNTDTVDHENGMCICDQALLNASNSNYFNVKKNFLYPAAVNITTLEIGTVSSFPISCQIKAEYTPPELFLSNSSFLL